MCQDCGCEEPSSSTQIIEVNKSLTQHNDQLAHTTSHELQHKQVLCVNLLGAPGSGKTSVIEQLAKKLGAKNIAVIQGDLESTVDKLRLEEVGIATFQINTHSGCHLNAQMIHDALLNFSVEGKKYLFIENVGNLVCPAGVKIGQHVDVVVSATTEGSDKPKKYPVIFATAKLVLISKSDIAQLVEFNQERYERDIKEINQKIKLLNVSTKDAATFEPVVAFLEHERAHVLHEHHHH